MLTTGQNHEKIFQDKAAIYDGLIEIVAEMLVPRAKAIAEDASLTLREKLERLYQPMLENNGESFLAGMIRLGCAEGMHLAQERYYHLVLEPLMEIQRNMLSNGREDLPDPRIIDYPQLFAAPIIQGLVWQGVFGDMSNLNLREAFNIWLDIALGPLEYAVTVNVTAYWPPDVSPARRRSRREQAENRAFRRSVLIFKTKF